MDHRLDDLLRQYELEHLSDEVRALTRHTLFPLAERCESEDALPLGASRIGGSPDLPPDFVWPSFKSVPQTFLAQIALAETAPLDADHLLPPTGWLVFFYDYKQSVWGFDPQDQGAWCVAHLDDDAASLVRTPYPAEPVTETPEPSKGLFGRIADRVWKPLSTTWPASYPACSVTYASGLTLPPWDSPRVERLGLSEDDSDSYTEVAGSLREVGPSDQSDHRLLGWPFPIQSDMEEECEIISSGIYAGKSSDELAAKAKEGAGRDFGWRLLFQLDTDDRADMMWCDCGMLYYWIREADLDARRFDRVWMHLQCS